LGGKISDKAGDLSEATKEKYESAKDSTKELGGKISDKAGDLSEATKEKYESAKTTIKSKFEK
jgi:hypothetical protein